MKLHNSKTMQRPGTAWKKLLNVATLGVFSVTPFLGTMAVSQANPPDHAPAWGYRRKHDRRGDQYDRDYNRGRYDRDYGRGRSDRDYGQGSYDQGRYGRRDNDYGYRGGYPAYTGRVTNVKDDDSFDVRIGGDIYNVYTNSRLPRRLSEGDIVRVSGERVGKNDIRNASVTILGNR